MQHPLARAPVDELELALSGLALDGGGQGAGDGANRAVHGRFAGAADGVLRAVAQQLTGSHVHCKDPT